MKSLKRQAGNGAILVIALSALLALGSTVYYKTRMSQPESVRQSYESSADELRQISNALTRYYRDNMSWPANLNELSATGYFNGDAGRCGGAGVFQSPLCTVIFGNQVGDDYALTVNLLQNGIAQAVANQVPGGTVAGSTVTATINRPFQSSLYDDYLQKVEDPDRAERTQLEVDLDINGNNLNNINSLNAAKVTIDNAVITNAEITRVNTERIDLGANSLTHAGNQLNLNAGVVSVNGTLSANGDVVGNGNNLTGFDTVSADSGVFTDLTATTGTITTLSGNTLDYNSGSIDTLNGNSLTYSNGSIASLDGNSLDYNTGVIRSLSGNSLNFGAGTIGNLSGNDASFLSGLIRVLNGNALTYKNINGTTGNFINSSSNNGTITNMGVTGNSSLNILDSNNGNVTTLTATNGNIVTGVTKTASGNSITVSGTSSFGVLDSDRIDTNSFSGNSVTADNGSVSGNALVDTLSVTNLNVSNRLQTNVVNSSTSSLGNASASKLSISGRLVASGINTSIASFDNAVIQSASGNNANYNTVSANRFNGGAFTSNDDFYTPISSVNKNYLLIDEQRNKLDNCVYVTKFCLPETPSVNLTCPTCKLSANRASFSGVATASISGCRQGCTYRWVTSGSVLKFSGCTGGSVVQGGSASPSCRVSTSLGPQQSASGNIKIIVTNNHYKNEISSGVASVSYTNTTPNDILDDINADCYVDTSGFDTIGRSYCSGFFFSETAPSGGNIVFSVGDQLNGSQYTISNSGYAVKWSGDCVGSNSTCRTRWSNNGNSLQKHEFTAIVTVTHISSGRSITISVFASVEIED